MFNYPETKKNPEPETVDSDDMELDDAEEGGSVDDDVPLHEAQVGDEVVARNPPQRVLNKSGVATRSRGISSSKKPVQKRVNKIPAGKKRMKKKL
jgi:hypothetical protein